MGWAAAAGAIGSAAGSIGGALISAQATEKAIKAQEKAIRQQQKRLDKLDPNQLNAQATIMDIARRANGLLAQQQVDPALAAIRRTGAEGFLRESQKTVGQGDVLADQLFREVKDQDPRLAALKTQLLDRAKTELAAGASLPPDFQAELVRSGLERGGRAGFGVTGQGAAGTEVRKLLGREGLQLQQARQGQAINLAGAAQDIDNARANILAGVFPKLKDLQTANLARQQNILAVGESTVPTLGLSGQDAVNIELSKAGAQNQLASQAGNVAAQGALAQGQLINNLIGQGTQLATSTIQRIDADNKQAKFQAELIEAMKSGKK